MWQGKLIWFILWPQGSVGVGRSTMHFFDLSGRAMIHSVQCTVRFVIQGHGESTPFPSLYLMEVRDACPSPRASRITTYPSHALLQTVLESLNTSGSQLLLGLYTLIMKLCHHHLTAVQWEGPRGVWDANWGKGQQGWQKEITHADETLIQPAQLQQHKELIPMGKGNPHRNKNNLTIRTSN